MSHTASVAPKTVYTGERVNIAVTGLDTGEYWSYGVKRDDNVWVVDDPTQAIIVVEEHGENTFFMCATRWLDTYDGDSCVCTVKVVFFDSGDNVIESVTDTFRLNRGGFVIPYTMDDDVAALPVSGFLPHDTKRNNLYRLMFALGVNIVANADGNPHFTFLHGNDDPPEITVNKIYNQGSVDYEQPYTNVIVHEHTYTPITTADSVTLFDNSDGESVTNAEVWFSQAPVIVSTIAATGLTLHFATETYAIVSGNGVLTGVPYTHTTKAVNEGDPDAPNEKTIKVTDATMVNSANSQNLLDRLSAYYCPQSFIQEIDNGIVLEGQKCGKVYALTDPFGGTVQAFLKSMDVTASAVDKAVCKFQAGYEPAEQESLYTHCVMLDKKTFEEDGGVFNVPSGVESMKVVMIGGGTGGGSGWPGKNGKDAYCHTEVAEDADISAMWYGAEGGDGGEPGAGGSPGRVLTVVIDNPASSYNYTIGSGGEGGAATGFIPDTADELRAALANEHSDTEYTTEQINALLTTEATLSGWSGSPNAGSVGTATTFGSYSTSDSGATVPTGGVYDPIHGEFYALPGKSGQRGGKGGARKEESQGAFAWVTDGESVTHKGVTYEGGHTGQPVSSINGPPECVLTIYGGNGAGAAVGLGSADKDANNALLHPHMDGDSSGSGSWEVIEDGVE